MRISDWSSDVCSSDLNGTSAEGRTDTAAAYLFDTIKLDDRWQLNGGVRVDRYTTRFSSMVVCGGRGPACGTLPAGSVVPGVDAEDSDTLVSWKVGALYKPSANGSLYANYAIDRKSTRLNSSH